MVKVGKAVPNVEQIIKFFKDYRGYYDSNYRF